MRAGGVGTSLDGVEVRSVAAGSCLCSVGNPPGSAGVPPASLYLQTACHPRPLPCKAHQTRLYGVLFHRAGVCAGETPALPGGLCAGGTPALPGGLSSRAVVPPPRAWPKAALMAVTTIKSTDSLEVESVRAGGVGRSLDGVEVRSVAAGSCLCSESPTLTAYLGWTSTRERGRPARILIPANSLPSKATPLQGAPNPPLWGALPSCRGLCGRDARAPGWGLCGRDARAPGWSFFTSRSASTASMAKGGADGRNDHQIDRLAGGRIRARWRSWQVTGWRRSPKCCGGLLFVFGGQSTRERGRPARILIPANSLPSKATPLQGAPNPPLRGALPSCRSLCGRDARAPGWGLCGRDARAPGWGLCGRDARAPGWGLCGRDARAPGWGLCGRDARAPGWSLLLPPARPLAGPSRASSNALVALWPFFVALRGNLFLSLGVLRGCPSWISYVSWLCSSATISRATWRPRSGWPGGREMAATTGWPPPP